MSVFHSKKMAQYHSTVRPVIMVSHQRAVISIPLQN
jgi:hypothetical protein